MGRIIRASLEHAAIFAGLCGLLILAFAVMPALGLVWYPEVMVSLTAISPIFFGGVTARRLIRAGQGRLTGAERLVLLVSLPAFTGLVAFVAEALVIFVIYGQPSGLSLADILLVPWSERYAMTGSSGFSFLASALFAAGFAGLVSIPARLSAALARAEARTTGP